MNAATEGKSFAEFFAGIGLVHEGLRRSGWTCVYANDIDPKKASMYHGQFGDAPYYHLGDVWETSEVLSRIPEAPFLATASFPCTDLSLAGHCKGIGGQQSSTYFGFTRVIRKMANRPKLVMLENVPGFLTSKGGGDFVAAAQELADLGYWLDAMLVDAKSFVPQSRPRVFIFGYHTSLKLDGLVRRSRRPVLGDRWQTLIDESQTLRPRAMRALMDRIELSTGWATRPLRAPVQKRYRLASIIDTDDGQDWWDEAANEKHYAMLSELHRADVERRRAEGGMHVATVYRRCRHGHMRAEVRFDNVAGCLRTPRGGSARQIVLVIDDGTFRFRWMSPREYARLQGAPKFRLAENTIQSLFGFGDGVCVPAIRWIDEQVLSPAFTEHAAQVSQHVDARVSA